MPYAVRKRLRNVTTWAARASHDSDGETIRADPFEKAPEEGIGYQERRFHRIFALGPAQSYVGKWLESFKDYPPRQKPGSFNLSEVMDKLTRNAAQLNTPRSMTRAVELAALVAVPSSHHWKPPWLRDVVARP